MHEAVHSMKRDDCGLVKQLSDSIAQDFGCSRAHRDLSILERSKQYLLYTYINVLIVSKDVKDSSLQ